MKIHTDYNIEPLTLSFGQLKQMLPGTAGQRLPTATALERKNRDILFRHENGNMSITVYRNGFYLYQRDDRKTVFAVDRCKQLIYKYQNDEVWIIPEVRFSAGPCLIPLFMLGDERICRNQDAYEEYWNEFSLNNNGTDWTAAAQARSVEESYFDELEDFEKEERLRYAAESLTERQRQILHMHIAHGLNQKRIAACLQLSPSAVRNHLNTALNKLRRRM